MMDVVIAILGVLAMAYLLAMGCVAFVDWALTGKYMR